MPIRADSVQLEHGLEAVHKAATATRVAQLACTREAARGDQEDEIRFLMTVAEQRIQAATVGRPGVNKATLTLPLHGNGVQLGHAVELSPPLPAAAGRRVLEA